MLEVPGWLDKEIVPNEPIVVKALKIIALGVLVDKTPPEIVKSRSLRIKCIPLATPRPNNKGSTIILAKLKGRLNKTEIETVNKAANVIGAKTKSESRIFFKTTRSIMLIPIIEINAACKNELIIGEYSF